MLPDSKGFLAFGALKRRLTLYKTSKRNDGSLIAVLPAALEFPPLSKLNKTEDEDDDIVGLGVASTGRYAMTCTSRSTTLTIWSLKGVALNTLDTLQVETHCAHVSPCARYVAAAGFTAVVAVWSVIFQKNSGEFKTLSKAFQLKGHTAAVLAFSFNGDSSRMASVSKDNTWKLWSTELRFPDSNEIEPCLLLSGDCCSSVQIDQPQLALSPDGRVIALSTATHLRFFSSAVPNGTPEINCQDVISRIAFDSSGRRIAVAVGRHVRLFHNVTGLKTLIVDLEKSHKKATGQSTKERIEKQIIDARSSLDALGKL